ncbi:unnamed protein product [Gulo gulo]|uniref:Uncharacterized protein n=1 Tax=Gulo gulo TaxID=48420 RepID=A0A9X9LPY3_GULGU|nr:unnamed protein product [Gulo gulo]
MDPADHKQDPRHPAPRSWGGRTAALQKATGRRTETYGTQSHQRDGEKAENSGLWRPGWNLALASL